MVTKASPYHFVAPLTSFWFFASTYPLLSSVESTWEVKSEILLRRFLGLPRRSPLQGPHGFDRIGCRIADTTGNWHVVEAFHVLESEFTSRYIGADLLDHTVMIDQGFCYPAIERRLWQVAQTDFPRTHFRQALFKVR
jgi:hypothetical protein